MAYRADIEIGVKGTRELERLRSLITQSTEAFESLNRVAAKRGGLNQTLSNYETQLVRAKRAIDNVTAGTQAETKAIREYVTAMGLANAARDRQNYLIEQEISKRRKAQTTIDAGSRVQGPALPPAVVPRTGGRGPASTLGGGKLGGIVGNAVIGGAFPLLFGQGGAAATGGAIGGLVGGAFGGAGGFAGSLLGTLIGQRAGQSNQVKELAADIGFTAEQTKTLATAFKQAGADFDKFQASVQNIRGLSLSIEDQADAIRLVSQLTDTYGGRIDKVTAAFSSALESGKVTQATLNQLTSEGIPIQEELARKYGVSRDAIVQMAKAGEISVQSLADVLVDMGNKGLQAGEKPKSAFNQFTEALGNTATAVTNVANVLLTSLAPAIDRIILRATQALNILTETINTELLRTRIQAQSGKILGPKKLQQIDIEAENMAAKRFPSKARGRQLVAGPKVISSQAQAEFQIIREQLIRNELQRFGFESGILKAPRPTISPEIGRIAAPAQMPPSGGKTKKESDKAAKDAAREAERVAKALRDTRAQTELLAIQAGLQDRIFSAEQNKNPLLAARLKGEESILAIQSKYAELIANEPNILVQEALVKKGLQEIENARLATAQNQEALDASRAESITELFEAAKYDLAIAQEKNPLKRAELEIDRRLNADAIKKLELTKEQVTELKRILMLTETIKNTDNVHNEIIQDMANAFAGTFSSALNAAADGTKNLGNALADLGQQLAATVAQMLIIYAIGQALGALAGGKNDDSGGILTFLAKGFGYKKAAEGAYWSGGFEAFAAGGVVTKPTMGLVGEGGEPEYIIPASKMSAAMSRYSAGARGSAVIPNSGTTEGDTSSVSGGTAVAGAIDVRFNVERINSVDYVTADQFQAGIRQAAQQGATQGEQRTLRRLQQSRSTRSRLGLT